LRPLDKKIAIFEKKAYYIYLSCKFFLIFVLKIRVADPDLDWIRIQSVPWIRIRDLESGSGSGSRRAKITHKSRKFLKVHVLKCWMASFES
jgi:hypothetical protein